MQFEFKYWAGSTADMSRNRAQNYNNDKCNYINQMITVFKQLETDMQIASYVNIT